MSKEIATLHNEWGSLAVGDLISKGKCRRR